MPGRNRAPLLTRRRLVVGLPVLAAAGAAAAALRLDQTAFSQRRGATTGTAYPAPPGRRLPGPPELGVYVGNEPHRVAHFERWLGRRVDGVLGYTAGETWGDIADPGWAIEMWRPIDRPIFWSIGPSR